MSVSRDRLIEKFTLAIREGNAGIFAGAGLSRASGYVDWKNFLRPLAKEVGLDIEKEKDFLSIAQYYRNESGTRGSINQEILTAFNAEAGENENIEIISRLPISTYWTTNYDKLIEKELEKRNRKVDVKIDSDQLSNILMDRDAIVYKMHGDVDHPANAVLTKDDYILYDKKRPLFRTILKGDLISKRLLFIGFSFEDPNLDYILDQIHALLDENVAEHYCFFRRVQKSDYCNNDEDYGYEKAKQELRARDLARYGIQTIFVNDYSEITEILRDIEFAIKRNNVFISGSADDYADWGRNKAEKLASKISEALVKDDFKITSGFGLGIGSFVINGALTEIYRSKYKHTDEYLCLRPFPQGIKDAIERQNVFTQYRKEMIEDTGVAIFLFGNKKDPDSSKIVDALGCWEEFKIARDNKDIIIPIGSTGFMAKKILDEVKANMDDYNYLENYIDVLETEMEVDKLVETVITIAKKQRMV